MSYLQIAILALIQGAAELLPVSSSAHVIVAERLMGLDPSSPRMTFLLVMLHTGTMFAVLAYFWKRWQSLVFPSALAQEKEPEFGSRFHFLKMIVLATAVTGVLGLGLKLLIERVVLVRLLGHDKGEVEHLFKNLYLMAGSLFAVGCIIVAAGMWEPRGGGRPLTPGSTLWIGMVQGLCLPFRGFSRSGATISMGLFRGVHRQLAEEFSFALAVVLTPPVIALELYRLLPSEQGPRRVSKEELHAAFAEGWLVESIEPTGAEVRPDFKDLTFSEGGPKAWFVVMRPELARRRIVGCHPPHRLQRVEEIGRA